LLFNQIAIGVLFKHSATLDEKKEAGFQTAILYTDISGQRRIRTMNFSLPTTSLITNVFKFVELDTVVNLMAKTCKANFLIILVPKIN